MAKIKMMLLITAIVFSINSNIVVQAEEGSPKLAENARSAILMDRDTGTILFEKNSHQALPPASITKIMTMLMIMEALDKGVIHMDTKIRTSDYAASMGGSQIFLEAGEEMSVKDMLKGIAMASGNDASVAMAEHLAGTEVAFVELMNKKAIQLGMDDTHFVNSNGLPAPDHVSSAHDIAIMSRELLKHEEITQFTSAYQDYLRKDSPKPFWLVNTNKLVRFYQGADGLKTGYTSEAKFCLAATAKRDQLRVISVVMGEPDTKTRNAEVSQLFDYAFSQFTNQVLYESDTTVAEIKIDKGSKNKLELLAPHQFSLLLRKGEDANKYQQELVLAPNLKAPIKKNEILGHLYIKKDGNEISRLDLVSKEDIDKASLWMLMKRSVKQGLLIKQ